MHIPSMAATMKLRWLRRERILLNAVESRRFAERLLAPPRPPTPRLLADMRDYKARVKSDLD
jgi:hypothetical protein